MKRIASWVVLTTLAGLGWGTAPLAAAQEDGIALAIVYDTSGSMRDPVPDRAGGSTAKYIIANRALIAVAKQIEAFATNTAGGSPRKIQTALYRFDNGRPAQVIALGPFDARAIEGFAAGFSSPAGNTPLGNSLSLAARAVMSSPLTRKHVLIITDGLNTTGPEPHAVLPALKAQAESKGAAFSVHFVAFDVDAKQFNRVKKLGATVVGAADEKQLNSQLQFILQRKILLEDEEPPTKK